MSYKDIIEYKMECFMIKGAPFLGISQVHVHNSEILLANLGQSAS